MPCIGVAFYHMLGVARESHYYGDYYGESCKKCSAN